MNMFESFFAWFLSLGIVVMVLLGLSYFVPCVIAFMRGHQSRWAILVLNIVFGWTFIGWIAALIWSLTGIRSPLPKA